MAKAKKNKALKIVISILVVLAILAGIAYVGVSYFYKPNINNFEILKTVSILSSDNMPDNVPSNINNFDATSFKLVSSQGSDTQSNDDEYTWKTYSSTKDSSLKLLEGSNSKGKIKVAKLVYKKTDDGNYTNTYVYSSSGNISSYERTSEDGSYSIVYSFYNSKMLSAYAQYTHKKNYAFANYDKSGCLLSVGIWSSLPHVFLFTKGSYYDSKLNSITAKEYSDTLSQG